MRGKSGLRYNSTTKLMKIIGLITVFVVTAVLSVLWNGYALSVLWRWFVVPVFGVPALSVSYAIGISIVMGYLTHQYQSTASDGKTWQKQFSDSLAYCLAKPAISLLFGWVVTLFIN